MSEDPLQDFPEDARGPLRRLAFALFHQSFVAAVVESRERAAGIDPAAPADAAGDWAALEKSLGKEAVDRLRNGGGTK
jgi:hypothetical protein